MDWYYAQAGRQLGPVDDATLGQLVAAGNILGGTLVWHSGMSDWQPYSALQQTAAPLAVVTAVATAPSGARYCAECGRPYPLEEMVAFGDTLVCAACKPAFAQKLREGVLPRSGTPFGGFWTRFAAVMIDGILMYIVSLLLSFIFMNAIGVSVSDPMTILRAEAFLIAINLSIAFSYETFFIGRFGATPGKLTCHLKVVRPDGSKVSYQRAAARYGAKLISSFTLGIGFIVAAYDDERRALHDRICETRVIRT